MSKVKRLLSVLLTVVFLTGVILPVYADEIDEARQKLQDVSRQLTEQQNNAEKARQQEKSVLGELNQLEQGIKNTENTIDDLNDKIAALEETIAATEAEIEDAQQELDRQVEILSDRLVFIYEKGGDVSYLEVLLSATDIKDFLTRYDMLNCIVEEDMDLIETIDRMRKNLDIKKEELESNKRELEEMKAQQLAIKAELDNQHDSKNELLSDVRQEKAQYEKAIAELEQASKELESMIISLQSGEQLGTGTYTWPTPGYTQITSPYGMRYHPILKQRKMHTGVDIGAPRGATIVAADSGTVIYAGWMGGYGQVIVVDHGQGISTLYAHQDRFLAGVGQNVAKGEAIGKVGSTGWSTGPHLHFEVRINGQHTNPMNYI